jgi:hypothetical protein
MRSHWTHATIIRRPTIAALAAAALLVACDQPAGPSRSGGRILANATGGTVSAHGSGTVPGLSSDFIAGLRNVGALKFSFDFSGTNTAGADPVLVSGKWSASDPVTNVAVDYTGPATVDLTAHTLTIGAAPFQGRVPCTVTEPSGTTVGACFVQAQDLASNGGVDTICIDADGANGGGLLTLAFGGPPCPQMASGNMNID